MNKFTLFELNKLRNEFNIKNASKTKKNDLIILLEKHMQENNISIDNVKQIINKDIGDLERIVSYLNSCGIMNLRKLYKRLGNKGKLNQLSKHNLVDIIKKQFIDSSFEDSKKQLEFLLKEESVENINKTEKNNIKNLNDNDIQYIVHVADLHIRHNERYDEYYNAFTNFINDLKGNLNILTNKTVVVVCGDIFHYKVNQKSKSIKLWNYFIQSLCQMFPVFVITGNHDYDMTTNDTDWIESTFNCDNFNHLNNFGEYHYKNIVFGCSPLKDDTIFNMKKTDDNKIYVQLYHGMIDKSVLFNGNENEADISVKDFGEYDLLLLGDIHKRQYLNKYSAYSGSLIQQNFGESIYNHGYILWNLNDLTQTFYEVQNDYCFLKVFINETNYNFDRDILKDKKFINVEYVISTNDSLLSNSLIEQFKSEIDVSGIIVIQSKVTKRFLNKMQEENFVKREILEKDTVEYIRDILKKENHNQIDIEEICNIHKSIFSTDDKTIQVTEWNLISLEFKNIFCYGEDRVNTIDFTNNGFYRLFANNFYGKTSIMNMIKWVLYYDDSSINDQDILFNPNVDKKISGYVRCNISLKNSDLVYSINRNINYVGAKLKSGVRIEHMLNIFQDNNIKETIIGKQNVEIKLLSLIGSYKEFELVSSINNKDVGIMIDNSFELFKDLFKLNRFEEYEKQCKELIYNTKVELESKNSLIRHYDRNANDSLEQLHTKLNTVKSEMNKIIISSTKEYDTKLKNLKEESFNIILKDETPYENYETVIVNLNKELSLHGNTNYSNLCNKYKSKLDVYNTRIQEHKNKLLPTYESNLTQEEIKDSLQKLNKRYDSVNFELNELNETVLNTKSILETLNESKDNCYQQINKYTDEKKLLTDKIKNVVVEPINDLLTEKNKIKTNLSKGYEKIKEVDIAIKKLNSNILNQYKLLDNTIQGKEEDIKLKIKEQPINYTTVKESIIKKLKTKQFNQEDYDNTLAILETNDYHSILATIKKNKLINEKITEMNDKLDKYNSFKNEINLKLDEFKSKLNSLNSRIALSQSNLIIDEQNKKYRNEIDVIENNITEIKDKYNSSSSLITSCISSIELKNKSQSKLLNEKDDINNQIRDLKHLLDMIEKNKPIKEANILIEKQIDILVTEYNTIKLEYENIDNEQKKLESLKSKLSIYKQKQIMYDSYVSNLEYNKIHKEMKQSLNEEIECIESILTDIRLKNQNMLTSKNILQEQERQLNKEIVEATKRLTETNGLNNEITNLTTRLSYLTIYKKLLNNGNIQSVILKERLPIIESYINDVLKKYTNFTITIKIMGALSKKKIQIFQKKSDLNELTIQSCSGFESIILNIACKLAIKKYCYINTSSILMIDEVLSKISTQNYKLLPNIFKMLEDNFNNILIITHITDIKTILEESMSGEGKNINIVRKGISSYIKA